MLTAQVQSKAIDDVLYHVNPLPAGVALRMAARVLKMASPAFTDIPSLLAASKGVNSALEALASGLVADLDENLLCWCAEQFAAVTQFEVAGAKLPMVSDKANHFDDHFRGRFTSMLKWLVFAASVTFPFVPTMKDAPAEASTAG
jgi:hypothetical protein